MNTWIILGINLIIILILCISFKKGENKKYYYKQTINGKHIYIESPGKYSFQTMLEANMQEISKKEYINYIKKKPIIKEDKYIC